MIYGSGLRSYEGSVIRFGQTSNLKLTCNSRLKDPFSVQRFDKNHLRQKVPISVQKSCMRSFKTAFHKWSNIKNCVTSQGLVESLRRPLRGAFFVKNRAATVEYLPTRIHGGSRGFSRPGGNPSRTPLFVEIEGGKIPGEPPRLLFGEFLV
jgi:hypothetical protein